MKKISVPFFNKKQDLTKFLKENKNALMQQKKFNNKLADGVPFFNKSFFDKDGEPLNKANKPIDSQKIKSLDELKVKLAINTTNLFDSHCDVHLKGLWKKSLKENRMIMHLQEHNGSFDHVISDGPQLKVYTQDMTWQEVGIKGLTGTTEVLIFESTILKKRNEYMFNQYAEGWVKNHSVGMGYVTFILCINDEAAGAEWEAWEKYFGEIANKEAAEDRGYFWAVKEAKCYEGSAVTRGSNWATPTLENNIEDKSEPDDDHSDENKDEPVTTTRIDWDKVAKQIEQIKI